MRGHHHHDHGSEHDIISTANVIARLNIFDDGTIDIATDLVDRRAALLRLSAAIDDELDAMHTRNPDGPLPSATGELRGLPDGHDDTGVADTTRLVLGALARAALRAADWAPGDEATLRRAAAHRPESAR